MYSLPTAVEIGGAPFEIREKGDYRMVLDCFSTLNDTELTEQERLMACLIIFYADLSDIEDLDKLPNIDEAVEKMNDFFNCGQDMKDAKNSPRLIDWEKDSMLVCSAVNNVAQKEVRNEPYLHWWTFMGYYLGIGECALSTIINIRYKIAKNIKLENHEKKFKQENPQYFNTDYRSAEQKEADEYVRSIWGSE